MVQTLHLRLGCISYVVIILAYPYLTSTHHWQIFIPVYWHTVHFSIATPLADASKTLLLAVAVSVDGNGGTVAVTAVSLGLEDAVRHTTWIFEVLLSPEVCQCLVLPEGAVHLHVGAIDIFVGACLLIHRHTE